MEEDTTSTGTEPDTEFPSVSVTLTPMDPAAPRAVSWAAVTVRVEPDTEALMPSGTLPTAYVKVEGSPPSGSVTPSARFWVTASPPASTRTPVGVKVGGWFWVARTRTGTDRLDDRAPASSPSLT